MCVYCYKELNSLISWGQFISKKQALCESCIKQFVLLKNESSCKQCNKSGVKDVCHDCKKWRSINEALEANRSLIKYTDFVKQYLFEWKYKGDVELFKGLFPFIDSNIIMKKFKLNRVKVIPIPIHLQREKERAFNQSSLIASLFPNVDEKILIRINNEKQSEKNKKERLNSDNPFQVIKKGEGDILLVDDLYTTGSTLRHAASKLKEAGYGKVASFTLFRS